MPSRKVLLVLFSSSRSTWPGAPLPSWSLISRIIWCSLPPAAQCQLLGEHPWKPSLGGVSRMEGQQVIRALGDAWGLVHSCSPPNPPLEAAGGAGLSLGHTASSWTWSGASPRPGSAWNCPRCPSTCCPHVRPHTAPVSLRDTWAAPRVRSGAGDVAVTRSQAPDSPPRRKPAQAPVGSPAPSLSLPSFVSWPEGRDRAIRLCPPQTVALFFRVTPAPTPGPAGWRRV